MTQQQTIVLPTNPADRKAIMDAIIELDGSMTRMDAERDYIKETIKDLADKHQLPKKLLSKFARDYHKQQFRESIGTNEDYEALVATLIPSVVE